MKLIKSTFIKSNIIWSINTGKTSSASSGLNSLALRIATRQDFNNPSISRALLWFGYRINGIKCWNFSFQTDNRILSSLKAFQDIMSNGVEIFLTKLTDILYFLPVFDRNWQAENSLLIRQFRVKTYEFSLF